MANFFTNPKQFINLLTTAQDCRNIFPGDQAGYNWDFIGLTDSDFNFSLEWVTVIVDRVRFNNNNEPNFTNSLVIGYFEGGTLSFGTTQNIRIPANMYTGPILPASETNIPITIVNLQWLKNNGETVNRQILFIQNYEPGVRIGDPSLDDNFIAIEVAGLALNTATVILELIDSVTVYEEAFRAKLICDVPNALAQTAYAKFYARSSTGTSFVLIHTSTWTTVTENLNVSEVSIQTYYAPGDSRNLPPDTYTIRGEWPGRRTWPLRVSNTLSLRVVDGVPLVVTLDPAPVIATVTGTTITLTATANTASGYPVFTTTNIANTVTFSIQGTSTYAALPGTRIITTTTFAGNTVTATATASLFISNDLVDIIPDANTTYTLITATIANNVFTGTALITRTYPLIVNWNFLRSSLIASGSTSTTLTVSTTRSFTVNLRPLTVEVNEFFGLGNTYGSDYNPAYATQPASTPNVVNLSNGADYATNTRSPVIRAYVTTSTTLQDTTITFTAVYTASNTLLNLSTQVVATTYTADLLAAPTNTEFRFENLPPYLKPNDTFRLAGITWPVLAFNTATNIVTTNNWNGVINPTSYFQTGVTFTVQDPNTNNAAKWLGYNYNTSGTWFVFGNNQQTRSGTTSTYQTWIPGDRWRISVPWFSVSTGFISTATYQWADNPLYYFRFASLPQNITLPSGFTGENGGGPSGSGAPYFQWITPGATNRGVRHYIRAVNYATNTVVAWPGGHSDNGGSIPKLYPDPKILPLDDISNVWIAPINEPENINQFAVFYNGENQALTATTTLTLGKAVSQAGNKWQQNSVYPNQVYQSLDVDTNNNFITELPTGTYQITANVDYSNLVTVLANRVASSTSTSLVVYLPTTPFFSSTVEATSDNFIFKTKLFKPIQSDVEFLRGTAVAILDGVTVKASSSNWVYDTDSASLTQTIPRYEISTLTNVTGFFNGNVGLWRWNSSWPKYTSSTFNFVVASPIGLSSAITITAPDMVYDQNYTIAATVTGSSTDPTFLPQGRVLFETVQTNIFGSRIFEVNTLTNGYASIVINSKNLFTATNTWATATMRASYAPSILTDDGPIFYNFPSATTTTTITLLPQNTISYGLNNTIINGISYRDCVFRLGYIKFAARDIYFASPPNNAINMPFFTATGSLIFRFRPGALKVTSPNPPFLLQLGSKMKNDKTLFFPSRYRAGDNEYFDPKIHTTIPAGPNGWPPEGNDIFSWVRPCLNASKINMAVNFLNNSFAITSSAWDLANNIGQFDYSLTFQAATINGNKFSYFSAFVGYIPIDIRMAFPVQNIDFFFNTVDNFMNVSVNAAPFTDTKTHGSIGFSKTL